MIPTRTSAFTRSSRSAGWRPPPPSIGWRRSPNRGDFFLAFPAIEALVRINDPMVAPRLAPLLRRSDAGAGCGRSARAHRRRGRGRPARRCARRLGNTCWRARRSARADPWPIPDIVRRGARKSKIWCRRRISPAGVARILDAIGRASGDAVRPLVVVLGWLQDPAIPPALARLLGSAEARHDVIEAFVRFGPSAVDAAHRAAAVPATSKHSDRRSTALGRIGDRRAVPALVELLREGDARVAGRP